MIWHCRASYRFYTAIQFPVEIFALPASSVEINIAVDSCVPIDRKLRDPATIKHTCTCVCVCVLQMCTINTHFLTCLLTERARADPHVSAGIITRKDSSSIVLSVVIKRRSIVSRRSSIGREEPSKIETPCVYLAS